MRIQLAGLRPSADRSATYAMGRQMEPATQSFPLWMTRLLWCASAFNLFAGIGMILFYHEGYRALGINKPELALPTQLVGALVLLFGCGYAVVARDPFANGIVLRLGWWSKALGSALTLYHYLSGNVPLALPLVVLFADVAWLLPFWIILRRIDGISP